jgi:predicted amidohydrolase
VVFPEAAVPGYVSENFQTWTDPVRRPDEGRSLEGVAETAEGETARFAAGLARDLRIYLAAPFIERDTSTGRYYNSVLLASPDGEIVGRYRKISPWPRAEATWASPGDSGLCIVETEFGRLGVMICYDSHSVARRLAEAGATTVLVPTAWVGPDPERWFGERLPAMARQLGLNLVAANWRFPADRPLCEPGAGCSKVIAADGRVLAGAQGLDDDEIVVADLPIPTDAAYGRGVPPPAGAVRP